MFVKSCLKKLEEFERELEEELWNRWSELPLHELCGSGGVPSDDEGEISELTIDRREGPIWSGVFTVAFVEESRTGCRDQTWTDKRKGQLRFDLNIETGEVDFDDPQPPMREYEVEEF